MDQNDQKSMQNTSKSRDDHCAMQKFMSSPVVSRFIYRSASDDIYNE